MDFQQLILNKERRWQRNLVIMSVVLVLLSTIHLMVGEVFLSPFQSLSVFEQKLLLDLRLPRLLAAAMIGAALAVSGATLQVLLGNVLAEPGVLGISGGASLAMVLVMFALPVLPTPMIFMLAAIAGSMLFTLILVGIARAMHLTTARLLLVGVAMGILSSAIVTWAFYFSDDLSLRQLMYWLMGSIGGTSWYQHTVTLVMLPVLVWLCCQGKPLDKLMLGEIHATQLGVDVHQMRWKLILAISVLVGCSVALGGIISFVGLVVPHLLRLTFGTENRYLLPLSAISGAALLVFADIGARLLLDSAELPLGVMTTSIGAPIFIWMLVKSHDAR
ncbi:TPA: vitamin B12 ABC transporter permease BtuC [Vibrio parahaemolyticus]|uniref:vitamin B12 ABC transporter permease BtuC n=1 Tax=Vibrio parahaemolyticus TaxID=670 RepID=UPI001A8FCE70|nr:vitamin B12 ABC transporter permease BtuC [Vibrio parahaemolyticus]MBO0157408.1 vitamin B12 ABC transporter permease BtuC [Vibrio parahaemolyticus]HCE1576643.1 vitamin B12 ABC transporter permease BtuC [Vibrio parahaemolyticus]HCG5290476.1 vitamin B12 ABC transporter permease BtuC [Vibrio parahaemolyticus]HCG6252532.1 vitamin B12 ABC transporter permease BtuC [Vibrio parahaemolyticus]HCG6257449.1 vitamin B12 ABC transporter permease BtuC [Vibrio parahaemolyticus]